MHMQPLSLKNKNVHGPLSMTNKVKKSTMGICTLTGLILPKLLQRGCDANAHTSPNCQLGQYNMHQSNALVPPG